MSEASCFQSRAGAVRSLTELAAGCLLTSGAVAQETREEVCFAKRKGSGERGSGQLLASEELHASVGRGEGASVDERG